MNRKVFFDAVRKNLFGGKLTQVQVEALAVILDEAAARKWPFAYTAYAMATAHWETANTLRWDIREFGRGKGRKYGKPAGPFGHAYYGRSWPQLTWYDNYVKQTKKLGIALDRDPDLMLTRPVAAKVLLGGMQDGDFTGKALRHYLDGKTPTFVEARRIVNGTDQQHKIARLADKYLHAIVLASAPTAVVPVPKPTPANNPDTRKDAAAGTGAAAGGGSAAGADEIATSPAESSLVFYGGLLLLAIGLGWLAWRNRRAIGIRLSILRDRIEAALAKL